MLKGFEPFGLDDPSAEAQRCPSLIFAGHVYTKNGYYETPKPVFPDPEDAMDNLMAFHDRDRPERMIFGGDSIWSPSNWRNAPADCTLRERLRNPRFILGNHGSYFGPAKQ